MPWKESCRVHERMLFVNASEGAPDLGTAEASKLACGARRAGMALQDHDRRAAAEGRSGSRASEAQERGCVANNPVETGASERPLVHRLEGSVSAWQRAVLLPTDGDGCGV